MESIKVLLISHNPFSTFQSMGKTFTSLFASFDQHELCQLYIYPSLPDVDMANSYYRMTDRDAIKSIFKRSAQGGEVSVREYTGAMIENKVEEQIYGRRSNNSPLKRILRDIVWSISKWNSSQLQDWLDKESPTCIFLAPGYAKFIYDIALKISKERKIPIVTYICDDYYFVKRPKGILGRYQLWALQKKIKLALNNTKLLITISEEIKKTYSNEFLINAETIMTGSSCEITTGNFLTKNTFKGLSYFGNIGVNREKPLADIGRVLDIINKERETDYSFYIYTNARPQEIKETFKGIKSIKMCGFLTGEDYVQTFSNADCLVHVEAFTEESIDIVKNSVSTKIAESLSSGIPLLAYAPSDIASIEHLRRNNCAFIANNYEELKSLIPTLIDDVPKRLQITEQALKVAKKYHCSETNSKRLRTVIEQIIERDSNE